jgi:lipid-binding SYLF domain-containing protein
MKTRAFDPSMRSSAVVLAVLLAASCVSTGCRTPQGDRPPRSGAALTMQREALAELYQKKPEARAQVQRSAGYAVFSNIGSKIPLFATGNGYGVATDNRTGKNTFMKMVEAGGGVGLGIKSYKAVYVFHSREAFEQMLEGKWQVGGDADAGAKYGDQGVSAGVAVDSDQINAPIVVYQFTDSGISLSAVATGTRYYPDAELN